MGFSPLGEFFSEESVPQRLKTQLFAVITDGLKAVPFNSLQDGAVLLFACRFPYRTASALMVLASQ